MMSVIPLHTGVFQFHDHRFSLYILSSFFDADRLHSLEGGGGLKASCIEGSYTCVKS